MLTRLADLGIRAPKRVLVLAALLFALAAAFGVSAADHLSSGGFRDPDAASSRAEDVLQQRFAAGDANLILEVRSDAGVTSPAARERGLAITRAVQQSPYATQVQSFWTLPAGQATALRSEDGTFFVIAHVQAMAVKQGQDVRAGQVLAQVGNNGFARMPHIHIGAWRGRDALQIRWDQRRMPIDTPFGPTEKNKETTP